MTANFFRPYRVGDLPAVWANIRPEDKREYAAVGVEDPHQIEAYLLAHARRVTTWDTESGPVALLGVTPSHDPILGLVWAIASDAALPRWRFAARHTPACLDKLGEGFRLLGNFKDGRNLGQIAWLKRVGFTFIATHENFEGTGKTFHEFVRIIP